MSKVQIFSIYTTVYSSTAMTLSGVCFGQMHWGNQLWGVRSSSISNCNLASAVCSRCDFSAPFQWLTQLSKVIIIISYPSWFKLTSPSYSCCCNFVKMCDEVFVWHFWAINNLVGLRVLLCHWNFAGTRVKLGSLRAALSLCDGGFSSSVWGGSLWTLLTHSYPSRHSWEMDFSQISVWKWQGDKSLFVIVYWNNRRLLHLWQIHFLQWQIFTKLYYQAEIKYEAVAKANM